MADFIGTCVLTWSDANFIGKWKFTGRHPSKRRSFWMVHSLYSVYTCCMHRVQSSRLLASFITVVHCVVALLCFLAAEKKSLVPLVTGSFLIGPTCFHVLFRHLCITFGDHSLNEEVIEQGSWAQTLRLKLEGRWGGSGNVVGKFLCDSGLERVVCSAWMSRS